MADIFGKTSRNIAGAFSVDKARLDFPDIGATGNSSGLLVQNIQISYQQQVSFVYDLAKADDVYYIAGRASGTLAMGKIVGSKGILKAFYEKFGNVCNVANQSVTLSGLAGCSASTNVTNAVTIREPVVSQFGLTMNVDTAIIGENVQMIFATLELS